MRATLLDVTAFLDMIFSLNHCLMRMFGVSSDARCDILADTMLNDWRGWAILVILLVTGYVQAIGRHIESQSGYKRSRNLELYRVLFGTSVWLIFRWGGLIHVGVLALTVYLFGWKTGAVLVIGVLVYPLLVWRIARYHAIEMLKELQKREAQV
jgi:hypothetical protein